ncbi:MAG TPA: ATP-binding protein [Opitutus sp.]|nr:ATP-binding protein [Opitutus sp.]
MHVTLALLAGIAVTGVGLAILWANPARLVNRAVFYCSLHVATWLALLHVAVITPEGLYWVRWSSCVGALLPLHLWIVKEIIARESFAVLVEQWKSAVAWVTLSACLAVLPFTEFFIPSHSRMAARLYGRGYYLYMAGVLILYLALCVSTLRHIRRLAGIRRLELQVWLLGGSLAAFTVILLMAANAVLHEPALIRLQPLVVLIFYGSTVAAITLHRVFDARQIALVGLEKSILVLIVALGAWSLDQALGLVLPAPLDLLLTTAAALGLAAWLNRWLDRILRFYPEAGLARQAAFAVARRETRVEHLEKAFLDLLKGWGQTEHALVLFGAHGALRGCGIEISEDSVVVQTMRWLRWATPERLARERSTPERAEVAEFLAGHQLGVLVIGEGPTLTALVGVGVPASRRPCTYPQVTQLIELTSIIESAMERAHITVKAQHAEQLATVGLLGASLAHEIRNPLVTIKTFVQLLPRHHQDATFREKFFGLIGEEVARIDRLTEQLLDLASPRAYHAHEIDLHPVLQSSIALVAAKATDKRIKFLTDFRAAPDRAFTDPSAARQVLLNLCFNAIQAVETIEGDRWVKVSTRNVAGGIEMQVEDSGPGIAEDIRPRLFQPFQSSKSSGFGLGLAICSDILTGLDATIGVDPATPGRGAVFRVVFPASVPALL